MELGDFACFLEGQEGVLGHGDNLDLFKRECTASPDFPLSMA